MTKKVPKFVVFADNTVIFVDDDGTPLTNKKCKEKEEIWIATSNRAAEEAAILADEGMDYEKALVFCNVD